MHATTDAYLSLARLYRERAGARGAREGAPPPPLPFRQPQRSAAAGAAAARPRR
jgi:hypothetical protein